MLSPINCIGVSVAFVWDIVCVTVTRIECTICTSSHGYMLSFFIAFYQLAVANISPESAMLFPSKKSILACLASLCFCGLASANDDIVDVVIIGAGWSGLAAANYLIEAGITENILLLEARDRVGGRSYTKEDVFKTGHPVELGSGWIYPETNVFDLVEELGIAHDQTGFNFDTFGLFNSTGELLKDEKSTLVDETFLKDFVKYADKMANDDVTWTDIKQNYFDERPEFDNSERQAINALVHTGM